MNTDFISDALRHFIPETYTDEKCDRAAVALVLRAVAETELLLIERAHHENDPWSGHIALPGGRMEQVDKSPRHAAERETNEELALDLQSASHIGQLNDMHGRHAGKPAGLIVSCYVYQLQNPVELRLNYEVETALWVPASRLLDPTHTFEYVRPDIPDRSFSGIRLSDNEQHVLWGMTHRFLTNFFDILKKPLPQWNSD